MHYNYEDDIQKKFATVFSLLSQDISYLSWRGNGKPSEPDSLKNEDVKKILYGKFEKGRSPKAPKKPDTVPDEVVSIVLEEYYGVDKMKTPQIKEEHKLSMAAENIVGELLERYLAHVLEPHGWVWCSGDFVKAIDFIKEDTDGWMLLQVKNRNNSENSSSSKIREGTEIKKWFRSFSKKNEFNWGKFPDEEAKKLLSEEGFREFVKSYLRMLKQGCPSRQGS